MTDLVTDAAIDAATYAIGLAPEGSEKLPFILTAAAPLIAAEALRQAARLVIEDARKEKEGSPPREDWATADGAEMTGEWLERMADELEGTDG